MAESLATPTPNLYVLTGSTKVAMRHPLLPQAFTNASDVAREAVETAVRKIGVGLYRVMVQECQSTAAFNLPRFKCPGIYQEANVRQIYVDFMHFLFFNFKLCLFYQHPMERHYVLINSLEMLDDILTDKCINVFALDLSQGVVLGNCKEKGGVNFEMDELTAEQLNACRSIGFDSAPKFDKAKLFSDDEILDYDLESQGYFYWVHQLTPRTTTSAKFPHGFNAAVQVLDINGEITVGRMF